MNCRALTKVLQVEQTDKRKHGCDHPPRPRSSTRSKRAPNVRRAVSVFARSSRSARVGVQHHVVRRHPRQRVHIVPNVIERALSGTTRRIVKGNIGELHADARCKCRYWIGLLGR